MLYFIYMEPFESKYKRRIEKVITFIEKSLEKSISLSDLSNVSCFSNFHFHRIFSSFTGESPHEYINRLRLEKAANILIKSKTSITELGFICGFCSTANFSRSFKKKYGITPSVFRKSGKKIPFPATKKMQNFNLGIIGDIAIKDLPDLSVVYNSVIDGYNKGKIQNAWNQTINWAISKKLYSQDALHIGLTFDNPEITPKNKCRYYACLSLPETADIGTDISSMKIHGGKYAVLTLNGSMEAISDGYKYLYGCWLPSSGYEPADLPPYDMYTKNEDNEIIIKICIPIVPLKQ